MGSMKTLAEYFRRLRGPAIRYDKSMSREEINRQIGDWRERVKRGSAEEALKVAKESGRFFKGMQRENPLAYRTAYDDEHKVLIEEIMKKVSGEEVRID